MSHSGQNSCIFMVLLNSILECKLWNRRRKRWNLDLEEFGCRVLDEVADGAFNKVYRCVKRDGNSESIVAIKEIFLVLETARPLFDRKISSLQKLQHENVVRLLTTFSRRQCVYLVFEHFMFDLLSFINIPNRHKSSLQRNFYLYQIISAVAYYHAQGVLHRDLKPKNIRIDYFTHSIKLANYDLACAFQAPEIYHAELTPIEYRAPELLLGSGEDTKETDMWSVGCIFGEMLTGQTLFGGKSEEDQLKRIFRFLGTPTEASWPGVTQQFSSISSYPKYKPMDLTAQFPDLGEGGIDLLSKLLCLNPEQRISAADALDHPYMKSIPKMVQKPNRSDFYTPGIPEDMF